jgi:hypothetical protein
VWGREEQRFQYVNGIECSVGNDIGEKKKQKSERKQRYQLQGLERHAAQVRESGMGQQSVQALANIFSALFAES